MNENDCISCRYFKINFKLKKKLRKEINVCMFYEEQLHRNVPSLSTIKVQNVPDPYRTPCSIYFRTGTWFKPLLGWFNWDILFPRAKQEGHRQHTRRIGSFFVCQSFTITCQKLGEHHQFTFNLLTTLIHLFDKNAIQT